MELKSIIYRGFITISKNVTYGDCTEIHMMNKQKRIGLQYNMKTSKSALVGGIRWLSG